MSTKIYEAWRIPSNRLRSFLDIVRKRVIKNVSYQIGVVMGEVDPTKLKEKVEGYRKGWEKDGGKMPAWVEKGVWTEMAMDLCELASAKSERDLVAALDCGFNIWILGKFAYLIPWGERYLFEKVRWPKWAKDYHYQNSSDRPDDVSASEWRAREKMWDRLCLGGEASWNEHRLCHEIVNFKPRESGPSRILFRRLRVPEQYAAEDRKYGIHRRKKR